jgi:uncharacterized protein (TIGR02271 family)
MDIYLDELTGQAQWLTINTGLFKTRSSLVLLSRVATDGEQPRERYDRATLEDAPQVDDSHAGYVDPYAEGVLYRCYDRTDPRSDSNGGIEVGRPIGGLTADPEASGADKGGRNAEKALTRSEEGLEVGTQRRETRRVRFRKCVVTEQVTQIVPVAREEIRVEREPLSDADTGAAGADPQIGEKESATILYEERPMVLKEVHPMTRVRLGKEVITGEETVSDEVRKEVIEPEDNDRLRACEHQG